MRRLLLLLASLAALALPATAHGYTFYEWDTAGPPRGLGIIANTLQFGLPSGQLGQSTLRGVQTSATVAGGTTASAFAPGPTGADLWFVDDGADKVGRITPGAPPVLLTNTIANAVDLASGSDGNVWVATGGAEIYCVTPVGASKMWGAPPVYPPERLASGRNGAVWFISTGSNRVGSIAPGGAASCSTDFPIYGGWTLPEGTAPVDIVAAPTGNDLYVAGANGLVRVTPNPAGPPNRTLPRIRRSSVTNRSSGLLS
jgi:streptogramin lyase